MKIIIAGSTTINDPLEVADAVACAMIKWKKDYHDIDEIISGNAKGIDELGIQWAMRHNKVYRIFPAHWEKYGKKAGYLRNLEMANYASHLIAIWDGKSKGTKHMIDIANKKGLKVYVYKVSN